MSAPLPMRWDGDAMVPMPGFRKIADNSFVIGQVYRLEVVEDRSMSTHNHAFAWLREAWQNLSEDLAELYPTPEHLRKRALIQAGFYDETIVDAGSNAAAVRVASAFRAREEFSLVIIRGPHVVLRTAKSQSRRHMDKATFQASKTAVMAVVAEMIGVPPEELDRHAGVAA